MATLTVRKDENNTNQPARATRSEWEPFRAMRNLLHWDPFRDMEPLVEWTTAPAFMPAFEVKETKESYVFKADLPGVKEADLEVTMTGNVLTVHGKRDTEKEEKGERYYACERSYGEFQRSFTLPDGVDPDQTAARLKDGVLTLTVPKKPEVQPKKVPIQPSTAVKA